MSTVNTIDKQILGYLVQLNPVQKKELLTVIKAIVRDNPEEDFEKEMNRRIAEYESGSINTYTWEESLAHAREAYSASKSIGERFAVLVNDKIKSIIAHPLWYGSKKRGYRETKLNKAFPYLIVYKFILAKKRDNHFCHLPRKAESKK